MLYSARDVAAHVLRVKGPMSTFKLQKLCYYGQAWHWTLHGEPLFEEPVLAWVSGPVVQTIYSDFHGRDRVGPADLGGDTRPLEGDALDVVDQVLEVYGDFDPATLVEWTHREDPWRNARVGLGPRESGAAEISGEAMVAYYSRQLESAS